MNATRRCPRCSHDRPLDWFGPKGKAPYCNPCFSAYILERAKKARERGEPTDNQKYLRRTRLEAMTHYCGGEPSCQCCGEANYLFLTMDHIGGGGMKHRKEVRADKLPMWLKRQGWPEGYRVLCWNCNSACGIYGVCPHQIERGEDVSGLIKPAYAWLLSLNENTPRGRTGGAGLSAD